MNTAARIISLILIIIISSSILISCNKVDDEDLSAGREVVVLASCGNSQTLTESVAGFNRANSGYYIKHINYSKETEDYLYDAKAKLLMDIVRGDDIDIVVLDSIDTEVLTGKDLLMDLYDFMGGDSDISKDIYWENVLKIFEHNGQLFQFPVDFYIDTAVGREGDELNFSSMPMVNISKDTALSFYLQQRLGDFIDFESGECDFISGEFEELLESVADFADIQKSDAIEFFRDNYGVLFYISLHDFYELDKYRQILTPDIIFSGIPTGKTNFNSITANMSVGALSKSKKRQGIYEYLKYISSDQFLRSPIIEFPITESALNQKINAVQDEDFSASGGVLSGEMIYNYKVSTVSSETVNYIMEQINSAADFRHDNRKINSIILEEAAYFFNNEKSSEEVCKIIQDRIGIYLSELY